MPIERSGSARPSASSRTVRNARRTSSSAPCGPIAIRPAHVEAEVAAPLDHRRDPLRRQPALVLARR